MEPSMTTTVGRGTAYLAATTWVLKGIGLLSLLIILNHLTVSEYGISELVITVVPLLSVFLLPGLGTTVIADMGRERAAGNTAALKGILLNFFRLQLVCAVAVWAAVFFGAQELSGWFGKGDLAPLIQTVSFMFLLSPLRASAQVLQRVYLRFFAQSVYSALEEAWKLVFLLPLFFVFNLRAQGLIAALVFSQLAALACMAPSLARIDRQLWRVRAERYAPLHLVATHGKWSVFSSYLGTVGKNIRPWIIGSILGTQAVGLFAVVQGLIGHVVSLFPLDQVLAPMLPQQMQDKPRFYKIIGKAVKYELAGYLVVSVAAALLSPYFISLFFPQYVPAVPLFQIMLVMLASSAFDVIFSSVFFAIQAQRSLFWASVYKLVLALVIMPPMLYFFGLFGIAYANIIINYLYVWERYRKLTRLMPGFSLRFKDFITVDAEDKVIIGQIRGLLKKYI